MNTEAARRDSLDIFLLTGSFLAIGVSMLAAGSMAIIAVVNNVLQLVENAQSAWAIALTFSLMGLLTVPGLYLSYRSINRQPAIVSQTVSPLFLLVGIGYPLALGLGFLSQEFGVLPVFLLPFAHVVAALTPMLFMSLYIVRRLPLIPWRRLWGQFTAGLWVSPILALFVELLAAIPILVLLFAYVYTDINPRDLIEPFASGGEISPGNIEGQLQALLDQPLLIILASLFVTVLVPLLEEIIKTVGLWPMLRRGLSPLYAFVGGAIAGGAYGLFEAFFLVQPGEGWPTLMIARAGATLMHMITTGMVSMGLARAIEINNWKTALRYYLYAVILHGFWNLTAIGVGVGTLYQEAVGQAVVGPGLTILTIGSGIILSLLAAGAAFGLHAFPKYLLETYPPGTTQETSAGVS